MGLNKQLDNKRFCETLVRGVRKSERRKLHLEAETSLQTEETLAIYTNKI